MKAFPKDVEPQDMTERHIGVESELYVEADPERQSVSDKLVRTLNRHGMLQNIGFDGGGREFRTNPISVKTLYQVKGHKYLKEYYKSLQSETKAISSGGTHIHISILNNDHENLEVNATTLGIAFYPQFQKIAGRNTHWAGKFGGDSCRTIEDVRNHIMPYKDTKRQRVYGLKGSILQPTRHQTFEFRGPKGSNDPDEVLAWIDFLKAVVNTANRESVNGVTFKSLLKGKRIAEYVAKLPKGRQFTEEELNQKVNVMALA